MKMIFRLGLVLRNSLSKDIALRAQSDNDVAALKEESRAIGDRVTSLDDHLRQVENDLRDLMLRLPNPFSLKQLAVAVKETLGR